MYSKLRVKYLQKMINKFDGLHDNIDKLISYENMNSQQTGGALAANVARLGTATDAIRQKIGTANAAVVVSNAAVTRLADERNRATAAARNLLAALTAARASLLAAEQAVAEAADTAQALAGLNIEPVVVPEADNDLAALLDAATAAAAQ